MNITNSIIASLLVLSMVFTGSGCGLVGPTSGYQKTRTSYGATKPASIDLAETITDFNGSSESTMSYFETKDGKYGFINALTGEQVPGLYDDIDMSRLLNTYFDHYEPVKKNGKWQYIDQTGKVISKSAYEEATSFYQGYAEVKLEGISYIVDKDLNLVAKSPSSQSMHYPTGIAFLNDFFSYRTGKLISTGGELTYDSDRVSTIGYYTNHYRDESKFYDDRGMFICAIPGSVKEFKVIKGQTLAIIHHKNSYQLVAIYPDHYHIETSKTYDHLSFANDAVTYTKGQEKGFLFKDEVEYKDISQKKIAITPYYKDLQQEYIAVLDTNAQELESFFTLHRFNFMNQNGDLLLSSNQIKVSDFTKSGLAAIANGDGLVKIIDTHGKTTSAVKFDTFTTPFSDPTILLLENNKGKPAYGIYDLKNNILIDSGGTSYTYQAVDDTITYNRGHLTGVKNRQGEILVQPRWTKEDNERGYKIVKQGSNKFVLMNDKGQVITDTVYRHLSYHPHNKDYVLIEDRGGYGLLDKTGQEIIAPFRSHRSYLVFEDANYAIMRKTSSYSLEAEVIDFATYENPTKASLISGSKASIESYNLTFSKKINQIKTGNYQSPEYLESAQEFGVIGENGMSYFVNEDGNFIFMNIYSGYQVPGEFKAIQVENSLQAIKSDFFAYGYEPVNIGDEWFYINIDGQVVSKGFKKASRFEKGLATVVDDHSRVINPAFETILINNSFVDRKFYRDYVRLGDNYYFYTSGQTVISDESFSVGPLFNSDIIFVHQRASNKTTLYDTDGYELFDITGQVMSIFKEDGHHIAVLRVGSKYRLVELTKTSYHYLTGLDYDELQPVMYKDTRFMSFRKGDTSGYIYRNGKEVLINNEQIYAIDSFMDGGNAKYFKLLTNEFSRNYELEMNYLDMNGKLLLDDYHQHLSGISSSGYFAAAEDLGDVTIYNVNGSTVKELEHRFVTTMNKEGTLVLLQNRSLKNRYAVYNLETNRMISDTYSYYEYLEDKGRIAFVDGYLTGEMDTNGNVLVQPRWTKEDKERHYNIVPNDYRSCIMYDENGRVLTDEYSDIYPHEDDPNYLIAEKIHYKSLIDTKGNLIIPSIYGDTNLFFTNDGNYMLVKRSNYSIDIVNLHD